jgi:hypothetical protein
MKQLDNELLRRVVVIVNDDLEVGGAGLVRACRFARLTSGVGAADVVNGRYVMNHSRVRHAQMP